jgi:hypothetical protein
MEQRKAKAERAQARIEANAKLPLEEQVANGGAKRPLNVDPVFAKKLAQAKMKAKKFKKVEIVSLLA